MRFRRWLIWLLWALALTVSGVGFVSAQGNRYVTSVDAAGQTHSVRYPEIRAAQSGSITAAVQVIVPVYEKFWNAPPVPGPNQTMDFRLFIDVGVSNPAAGEDLSGVNFQDVALPIPSAPAVWNGRTEATTTNVCAIQLYDVTNLYSVPGVLEYELALDLAKCYLLHYAATSAALPDWWLK